MGKRTAPLRSSTMWDAVIGGAVTLVAAFGGVILAERVGLRRTQGDAVRGAGETVLRRMRTVAMNAIAAGTQEELPSEDALRAVDDALFDLKLHTRTKDLTTAANAARETLFDLVMECGHGVTPNLDPHERREILDEKRRLVGELNRDLERLMLEVQKA